MTVRISKKLKSIVMVHDPRVMATIPHARTYKKNGNVYTVVPHRATETKLLGNLGYDVPAPILSQYDWCGTTPYIHQKVTAALVSVEPRAYILNGLGCVDSKTEYLTPTGWKHISDYKVGGKVAQYNRDGSIEFVLPQQYIKLPCDTMFKVRTKYGVDQLLSPEHRMLITTRTGHKEEVITAAEMFNRQFTGKPNKRKQIGYKSSAIPVTFTYNNDTSLPMSYEDIRVMVAVKADGYYGKDRRPNTVSMRLKKTRKKERIRLLLEQAGIPYKEVSKDYPTAKGFTVFTFRAPEASKKYHDGWWAASESQRAIVADEVLFWDGSTTHMDGFYSSIGAEADYIQFVFASLGRTARVLHSERHRRGRVEQEYRVSIRKDGKPVTLHGATSSGDKTQAIRISESTDGFKYCFTVPSSFLLLRRNGCIFATGNSGKTRSAAFAADFLMRSEGIRSTLVIAPLSTLSGTWENELFKVMPHCSVEVLYGTKEKRLEALRRPADFYIINTDGVNVILDELISKTEIGIVIVDELALFRNKRTRRWKALKKIIVPRAYVWGLTGLPTPNGPTDAWGQAMLLSPQRVPQSFKAFQSKVEYQITQFKWLPKANAQDVVAKALQPSVRFATEDCIDLPPTTFSTRTTDMSKEQKKAYKDLVNHFYTQYKNQEINAANAGVKLSKLLQVACGFNYSESGKVDYPNNHKTDVVKEIILETKQKVLVLAPFKHTVDMLHDKLRLAFQSCAKVYGDTTKKERDRIFHAFRTEDNPKVIVAHPAVLSHGLTLVEASVIIWYSPTMSYETYEQANARIVRPGQKHHTHVINIESCKAEEQMFKRLAGKEKVSTLLLDLMADITKEKQ